MAGFVLHVDIDAFFCQAEQLRDPSLQGKPIAVQQHQDIIAANHAAKSAGVVKHMPPAEARRLLAAVGGRVVHVHLAEGGRVSYQPYRELSARLLRLLRAQPWAAVVEKASIDEAFVLIKQANPGAATASTAAAEPCCDDDALGWDAGDCGGLGLAGAAQAALQRAREVKAAVLRELGLVVSVGAAPNRLMAKLASAAAKPDGVRLVGCQQEAVQLLSQTPARRLPGYGGKAAEAFEQHGIGAATDLQRLSQQQMEQLLGLKPAAAAQLHAWCRGLDNTPVQDRGPPKTLSVQMSLTPQLVSMHPSHGLMVSAAGGRAGVFEPLVTGRADFRPRVRQLMCAMGLDLLQRVQEDRAEEGRWPRTLSASMRAFGAGRDQSFTSRSGAFPTLSLGRQAQQAQQQREQPAAAAWGRQQQAEPAAQQGRRQAGAVHHRTADDEGGGQPQRELGPLEEVVVSGLEQLVHQAAASYPPAATVVELRLVASSFEKAAAAAPISRFFAAVPASRQGRGPEPAPGPGRQQERQLLQRQQQGQQQEHAVVQPADGQHPAGQQQWEQQSGPEQGSAAPLQAAGGSKPGQPPGPSIGGSGRCTALSSGSGDRCGDADPAIDLGSVDIHEQQQILHQIKQQQQQRGASHKGQSSSAGDGGGGRKRGGGKGAPAPDAKQPKILGFLKR
ncbi:hypothetical protein ABPG77_000364 [Micractinium sp. CCAP 211/92]